MERHRPPARKKPGVSKTAPRKTKPSKPSATPPQKKKKSLRSTRRNLNQMRKDLEASSFSASTFKFPAGLTKMRIIMSPKAERWYAPVTFGYIPNAEGKKKRVISPKSMDSEAHCPLLETFFALKRMGRDDEANEVKPTSRYLVHAMIRTENHWERKRIELPQTVWEPIVRSEIDALEPGEEDEDGFVEGGGIADRQTGRIVNVRRIGEGGTTKYSVTIGTKPIPAQQEWTKDLGDLEEDTIPTDASTIEEALCEFLGLSDLSELTNTPAANEDAEEDYSESDIEEDGEEEEEDEESWEESEEDNEEYEDD